MDIYEYLKLDHKKVSALFKQFKDSDCDERKRQIAAMLAHELTIHAKSEQETFYVALQRYETSKEEAHHGKKEHKEIEDQIKTMMGKLTHAQLEKNVEQLKKLVDHHVNEEEGKIFKRAKAVLSKEEAYELKEKMHFLKGKMLTQKTLRY